MLTLSCVFVFLFSTFTVEMGEKVQYIGVFNAAKLNITQQPDNIMSLLKYSDHIIVLNRILGPVAIPTLNI